MIAPFVCFSLPRSRSAWLSAFLGAPDRVVGHDIGALCANPAEFAFRLQRQLAGTCETGAGFAWRLIRRMIPEARFVVINRPASEVCASLERFGLTGLNAEMAQRQIALREISRQPATLTLDFADLAHEQVCGRLYEFCTGEEMDPLWFAHMDRLNIQVDMARRLAMLQRNAQQIANLKAIVVEALADA